MSGIASPWFDRVEYEARLDRVQRSLVERGLDGLVAFQPETVTWLTGFFTRGYGSLQCAIIPASGLPAIICRDVEEYYLDATCVFPDRAMWSDGDDSLEAVSRTITRLLGKSARLGIELSAWPLSAGRFGSLNESLPGTSWHDERDHAADQERGRNRLSAPGGQGSRSRNAGGDRYCPGRNQRARDGRRDLRGDDPCRQ